MGLLDDKLRELATKDERVLAAIAVAAGLVAKPEADPQTGKPDLGAVDLKDIEIDEKTEFALEAVDTGVLSQAKAEVHVDAGFPGPYTYKGVRIAVLDTAVEGDFLRVFVAASVPTDNPYYVRNAPIQVTSGEDDPERALRIIVGDAVIAVAQSMGWERGKPWRP